VVEPWREERRGTRLEEIPAVVALWWIPDVVASWCIPDVVAPWLIPDECDTMALERRS
jgi:hypothetical protein